MTHETPHQEAPASLADGLAAIASELRAMAQAQQAEAGIAAAMQAAVLCLLVSLIMRLADMAEAWHQGRLTLPPTPTPATRYTLSTRPDSLHRLARLARRVASRRTPQAATQPARPPAPSRASVPTPASEPYTGPAPALRRPAPLAFSKPAQAAAPSHVHFVTMSKLYPAISAAQRVITSHPLAKSSIRIASSGLWLPFWFRTNSMQLGTPACAKLAASCPPPLGMVR